jgi:hypothetical protein
MEKSSFDTVVVVRYAFDDLVDEAYYMINVQRLAGTQTAQDILFGNRIYNYLLMDTAVDASSTIRGEFTALLSKIASGDTMIVSLSSITEEYFNYLSLNKEGYLGPGLLMEAYNLPTNVSNGYGFFNLYYRDSHIFVLGK